MTAVLPGPGVELEICLALGRQTPLAGVWDTGKFDIAYWAQTDTSLGDWVDVTCDAQVPFELHAGTDRSDGVVTRWEAATTGLTLYGDAYNPRSGPYTGLLGPGLPVRIRYRKTGSSTWLPAFNGYVDDDGFTWTEPAGHVGRAQVAATDGTRILNAADLMARTPVGAGETAAQRVTRIADAVVWPADRRNITAGGVAVRSTDLSGNAWSQLLLVADTDLAHLWIDAAGVLRYVPQGRVSPQQAPVAYIGCGAPPPGLPAIPPVSIVGQQPTVVRNVANIQRSVDDGAPAGAQVTLTDDRSVSRYLRRPYTRTDLVHTTDAYSTTIAQAVLTSGAWPAFAPQSVQITSRAAAAAGPLLLALEPDLSLLVEDLDGTRWTCQPTGWSVQVGRDEIRGTIGLVDVSQFVGDQWDTAAWDNSKWSY